MTTPCPAHHLEPAFLSIKNVELFFLPSVNQSSKDMRCFEASFTVGRGVSERVLSKVQGIYVFFKRLLRQDVEMGRGDEQPVFVE